MKFIILLISCLASQAATLSFQWGAADPVPDSYALYAVTGNVTNVVASTIGTNAVISVAEAQWSFYVTALYPGLESAPSNVLPISVLAPPAPVQNVATAINGLVTMSWIKVLDSYYVTNYTAVISKSGFTKTNTTSSSTTIFSGITGGHYTLTVRAANMVGPGLISSQALFIPGKPGNLVLKQ